MSDVPVIESSIDWLFPPPRYVSRGSLFGVVARFDGHVVPSVYEAYRTDKLGHITERWLGRCVQTSPGLVYDGDRVTYVLFNIRLNGRGKFTLRFRLSWKQGHHLYGGLDSFKVKVRDEIEPTVYCTEHQDTLAVLDPENYRPTPVDQMNERAECHDGLPHRQRDPCV